MEFLSVTTQCIERAR